MGLPADSAGRDCWGVVMRWCGGCRSAAATAGEAALLGVPPLAPRRSPPAAHLSALRLTPSTAWLEGRQPFLSSFKFLLVRNELVLWLSAVYIIDVVLSDCLLMVTFMYSHTRLFIYTRTRWYPHRYSHWMFIILLFSMYVRWTALRTFISLDPPSLLLRELVMDLSV